MNNLFEFICIFFTVVLIKSVRFGVDAVPKVHFAQDVGQF